MVEKGIPINPCRAESYWLNNRITFARQKGGESQWDLPYWRPYGTGRSTGAQGRKGAKGGITNAAKQRRYEV
jgi:hypothetical protein